MNEAYVSYDVAKLLDEKGFDWNHRRTPETTCPTQQMACDWVEKIYGFFIEISRSIDINGNYHYFYMILDKTCKYASSATRDNDYSSKSDAVEAALEYVLTNLI